MDYEKILQTVNRELLWRHKDIAFTSTPVSPSFAQLIICVRNEPGYHPFEPTIQDTSSQMEMHVARLNERLGLNEAASLNIIASTMRGSIKI